MRAFLDNLYRLSGALAAIGMVATLVLVGAGVLTRPLGIYLPGMPARAFARRRERLLLQTIDLAGDTAHGETYWMVVNVYKGSSAPIIRGGRYIDRFERRNGLWAISARVCFTDWNGAPAEIQLPPAVARMKFESGTNSMDRNDLSYMRPLVITREQRNLNPHGEETSK